jgi:hypothetical protein
VRKPLPRAHPGHEILWWLRVLEHLYQQFYNYIKELTQTLTQNYRIVKFYPDLQWISQRILEIFGEPEALVNGVKFSNANSDHFGQREELVDNTFQERLNG